ncbi:MAG: preprotein translocase subunit YajC [Propionibacteriaceae bacterium]|nr:preprotein translocase subunit YajC [Propionibacteriaceae bacterium]
MDLMTTGLLIALMVASFYFLIIRPNRKRQAEHARITAALVPGVRVMLNSALYGTVTGVGERQVSVEVSPGVEIKVLKQAVLAVVTPDSPYAEDDMVPLEDSEEWPTLGEDPEPGEILDDDRRDDDHRGDEGQKG